MRNLYALTPGELLVGQELEKRGCQVYIPTKDKGIDLLATKGAAVFRLQVKESRVYLQTSGGPAWTSWTQLPSSSLRDAAERGVDLFVFVIHALDETGRRVKFKPLYVVIPPMDLDERLRRYRRDSADRSVYWFVDGNERLWELRGKRWVGTNYEEAGERDFTDCLHAWPL
jgi:hypothetical protein